MLIKFKGISSSSSPAEKRFNSTPKMDLESADNKAKDLREAGDFRCDCSYVWCGCASTFWASDVLVKIVGTILGIVEVD